MLAFSFLLLLLLVSFPLGEAQPAGGRRCWSGSSNPAADDYPPVQVDCSATGMECERTKVKVLDFFVMSCVSDFTCQRDLADLHTPDLSLYSEVICCTTDLCNAADGTSGAPSPRSRAGWVGILLVGAVVLLL